ncbi:MAG TPA: hypothetical protein VGL35_11180 [Rhizomicrobium sp.]|jgi:hypothetical protein
MAPDQGRRPFASEAAAAPKRRVVLCLYRPGQFPNPLASTNSSCREPGSDTDPKLSADFRAAMLGFLRDTVPKTWHDLCDSVSDNFRIISPDKFRVLT